MSLHEMITRLQSYHLNFDGDTYDLCAICEGYCERHLISCLIPGEVELISSYLNISPKDFVDRYADGILISKGEVTVLRLCSRCPFIDDDFKCTIKPVKPIMCDIYPVYAEVDGDGNVDFDLDPACPLTHYPPAAQSFREKCIPALRELSINPDSYVAIEEFDCLSYNFDRFDELCHDPQERKVCSLQDVLARTVDLTPGRLAAFFESKPEVSAGPGSHQEQSPDGLQMLATQLAQSDISRDLWPEISRNAISLKAGIWGTDDPEYLTTIQHLALMQQADDEHVKAIHCAVAVAALYRIPANQRDAGILRIGGRGQGDHDKIISRSRIYPGMVARPTDRRISRCQRGYRSYQKWGPHIIQQLKTRTNSSGQSISETVPPVMEWGDMIAR